MEWLWFKKGEEIRIKGRNASVYKKKMIKYLRPKNRINTVRCSQTEIDRYTMTSIRVGSKGSAERERP